MLADWWYVWSSPLSFVETFHCLFGHWKCTNPNQYYDKNKIGECVMVKGSCGMEWELPQLTEK